MGFCTHDQTECRKLSHSLSQQSQSQNDHSETAGSDDDGECVCEREGHTWASQASISGAFNGPSYCYMCGIEQTLSEASPSTEC